jgi:enoyl-CoA hydratase/carnithine racemase
MESTATESVTVERLGDLTVVRFHWLGAPIGMNLDTTEVLWRFIELEKSQPSKVLMVFFAPELIGPGSLEMLTEGDGPREMVREGNLLRRWVEAIRELPTYVIGVIQGEVALRRIAPFLACDYCIAADDTRIVNTLQQMPVAPTAGVPWFLTRLVGPARASNILLELKELSAHQARGLGLVNFLAPPDTLEQKALEVAQKFAAMPRATLVGVKRALVEACEDLSTYLDRESALVRKLSASN